MVDARRSNHFVALLSVYTPYVTMGFERRRLIGSDVFYGIVNQSLGASTEVYDNWKWTYASLRPPTFHTHSTYAAIPPTSPLTWPHEDGSQRQARYSEGREETEQRT